MSYDPSQYPATRPMQPTCDQVPPQYQPTAPPYPPPHGYYTPPPAPKKGLGKGKITLIVVASLLGSCAAFGLVGAIFGGSPPTAQPTNAPVAAGTAPARTVATTGSTHSGVTPASTAHPKPPKFKAVTSREWLKIAKNPDAHLGEALIIYGSVSQFDTSTGSDTFRADVGGTKQSEAYDYPTNAILTGEETALADLVEDDQFQASVLVQGSLSYETTLGGEMTVPKLAVRSIKVL